MQEYLPLILTAVMGSALATKLIKNGVEGGQAFLTGAFKKIPPGATRILAVVLGAVVAMLEGQAPATDALVGALSGALLTGTLALIAKYKPTRVPE